MSGSAQQIGGEDAFSASPQHFRQGQGGVRHRDGRGTQRKRKMDKEQKAQIAKIKKLLAKK
jgi:hypothetical protein